ncbi:MAG: cytochrome c-type biogenesis protein CcmH [Chromatiales bacterium]|jgi:cytochrome c-type biogenesis protein CcmH|nr:cytochrome c-type biogenesis protein CcmH [Chromatiales bacterium]MDX9765770.1 cytochrome c-type biogenesis protein CcmH [Ectothiorhodospiraceae bacterium]
MTRRICLSLIVGLSIVAATATAQEARPLAEDPAIEQRMIKLSEDLRCLVCQNESLAGSQSGLAEDLRREIREQMKAGQNDREIVDYLVDRYGDFVLYRPPLKPTTWLLWFGPFIMLLGAVTGLVFYLRRRNRRVPEAGLSDAERHRIEALLNQDQDRS